MSARGVLVIAMRDDCAYNYAFAMLRRALRWCDRARWTR
jgi:hypothetical protein